MRYSKENQRRIIEEYSTKNLNAKKSADARQQYLQNKIPELIPIDNELSKTGLILIKMGINHPDNYKEELEKLKEKNNQLLEARKNLLEHYGFDPDYDAVKYECNICNDVGYVKGRMCSCLKKKLAIAGYENSGIGKLIEKQSFENFDFRYYSGDNYNNMKNAYSELYDFACNFENQKGKNFLFIGSTGLGKTHLSTSVAKIVIDKGYDVVYDNANNIISAFEDDKFKRGYSSESKSEKYLLADLLIIDDLGAEFDTQMSVSTIYNIISTRLNNELSTIVSTNLSPADLESTYTKRIASRFFGEYDIIQFKGEDIRFQKLKDK